MIGTVRNWRRLTGGLIVALILAGTAGVVAQIAFYQKIVLTGPCQLSAGAGTPEGAILGSPCDMFLRTNGGAGTVLYLKETGAATNTGWAAIPPGWDDPGGVRRDGNHVLRRGGSDLRFRRLPRWRSWRTWPWGPTCGPAA